MNIKTCLLLNQPYKFKDVCVMYPISLKYAIDFDNEVDFLNMFMPYMISKEVLSSDNLEDISLFEVVLSDDNLCNNFILTLQEICRTDNLKFNRNTLEIFIDDNTSSLNKDNFDEFSDIVLEMVQSKRLEKAENSEPKFKTEEGRKRWLALQEQRKRRKEKEQGLNVYDIINIVQFGMGAYIPDSEILSWTYWKLLKSYSSILNKKGYENSFDIYLQCGDSKLIEKHWSELIKL